VAAPLLRINVRSSKALQATILALKGMPPELSKQTRKVVKTFSDGEWSGAVARYAKTDLENVVLTKTARVAVTNQNVTLKSATVGRALPGGAKPSVIAKAAEFGALDGTTTPSYQQRSRRGKRYTVRNRRNHNQFRGPSRSGYAVYQAAAKVIPKIAAAFVQTTVRTLHEQFEKGQS